MHLKWIPAFAALLTLSSIVSGDEASSRREVPKPEVLRLYADRITEEGWFTPARFASGLSIAKGGVTLTSENGSVVILARDQRVLLADGNKMMPAHSAEENFGSEYFLGRETNVVVKIDECVVMLGSGERIVDFKPAVNSDGEISCQDVKLALWSDDGLKIKKLQNVPLKTLGKAVEEAKDG